MDRQPHRPDGHAPCISDNDEALYSVLRTELYTSVLGDILDELGYRDQFLPPEIRPLRPDMVIAGRAMPVVEQDLVPGETQPAFGQMFAALDDLRPHEIYLASGSSSPYALWGELMTKRAKQLGAGGAILNGYIRDTHGILRQDFPCFARGSYARDQKNRGVVTGYRIPVRIGSVLVNPGDLVFGDSDGVLIIPRQIEVDAIERAAQKVRGENTVRNALERGLSAQDAFRQYGLF